jgi:hypothetical protein
MGALTCTTCSGKRQTRIWGQSKEGKGEMTVRNDAIAGISMGVDTMMSVLEKKRSNTDKLKQKIAA